MQTNTTKTPKDAAIIQENEALKAKIKELERALLRSEVKEDVGFAIARKTQQQAEELFRQNRQLEERNQELEDPEADYHSLSWTGKIVFSLRKLGRPLRKKEIMRELTIMDASKKGLSGLANASGQLSVALNDAVRAKRLFRHGVAGTRGFYYALPEWTDEYGTLHKVYRDDLY